MISLAKIEERRQQCMHERSITCLPGSGSAYFCDDCGTYLDMFWATSKVKLPQTPIKIGRWKDHLLGPKNAHRLW